MGAVLPWLLLVVIFITAFAYSRGLLFLLIHNLPLEKRIASSLAQDWVTIGAFLLGGWFIVSVVAGPSYPLVAAATVFLIGGVFLLTAGRAQRSEPNEQRNSTQRYLIVWLAGCLVSAFIAYLVLWSFSLIIMVPAK